MEKEDIENYKKAGKILLEVQEKARKSIKEGEKLLDIAERIEKNITVLGGKPAFPVNLSLNNTAAHYTPSIDDKTVISSADVLKVDIGVHVEGRIADAAFTMDFSGKWGKLVKASEMALENVLKKIEVGMTLGEIGKTIEETIKSYGFNPIQNLSGHGLLPFIAHANPSISNIARNDNRKIENDKVYAIEPFACNGAGIVKDAAQSEIFELDEPKPIRNRNSRLILEKAAEEYFTLPFAERWIGKQFKFTDFQRKIALRELMRAKCIKAHPILREENNVMVSQAENSLMAVDGKIIVLVQ